MDCFQVFYGNWDYRVETKYKKFLYLKL
jgi:hypothetical protein